MKTNRTYVCNGMILISVKESRAKCGFIPPGLIRHGSYPVIKHLKSQSWVGADCLLVKTERHGWGWCGDFMKTSVWIACFQLYAGTFSLQILISSGPFKFWKKQFKKKKRKKKKKFLCVDS